MIVYEYRQNNRSGRVNISTRAIVSNSEITKNYKACREKADVFGKIFIVKNNQPDAVLFSREEYERLSIFIEYIESLEEVDLQSVLECIPRSGNRKSYTISLLRDDMLTNTFFLEDRTY